MSVTCPLYGGTYGCHEESVFQTIEDVGTSQIGADNVCRKGHTRLGTSGAGEKDRASQGSSHEPNSWGRGTQEQPAAEMIVC